MADSFVRVPPDSTGKLVDTEDQTTGAGVVQRQRIRSYAENASNTYGEQGAVTPGATATLVSFVAPAGWRFYGIVAGGEADGYFTVEYNAVKKYASRTNISKREADFILPVPDAAAGGTVVTVKVRNEGAVTSAFEATLLGA